MLSWHSNPYRHWGEPIVLSRCCKYYICHQPPAIRRETAGQVREPAAAPRAGRLEMKPERVLKQIGGILTDSGNRVNPWRHSAASKRSRSTNRAGTNLACLQEPCLKQNLFHSYLKQNLFHSRMIRPVVGWRETGSKSSVSRLFINIDAQDAQDYLARGYTFLSSTIAYASTGIPKTRSHAHGSLRTRTRSSSQSASCAAASRPVYPVYPVYRCSQIQPTGLTGHWSLFATGPEGFVVSPSNDPHGRAGAWLA